MRGLMRILRLLGRARPALGEDDRSAEARALMRTGAPRAVVIDSSLAPTDWYVVRGLRTAQERAIHAAAASARDGDGWADTVQM